MVVFFPYLSCSSLMVISLCLFDKECSHVHAIYGECVHVKKTCLTYCMKGATSQDPRQGTRVNILLNIFIFSD